MVEPDTISNDVAAEHEIAPPCEWCVRLEPCDCGPRYEDCRCTCGDCLKDIVMDALGWVAL